MNPLPLRLVCLFCCILGAPGTAPGQSEATRGQWKPPSPDGKAWKHPGTGLSFPQHLGDYRLAGEFEFRDTGVFIRYENLDERARADVFLFPAPAVPKLEDRHRLILKELDAVVADFQDMASRGRYKNVQIDAVSGGEIPMWQQEALPIATRTITATRVGTSDRGIEEGVIKQWVGVTHLNNHLLTIRHLRPADTGDEGDAAMKSFVGTLFQVVKDPPLRAEVRRLIDVYLAEPWTEDGAQAAGMVLTYLQQTPFYPIGLPEEPISTWLDQCKARVADSEGHLLRAFMIGTAKAALDEANAETILNEGCRQFALIYRELLTKYPQLADPELDQFAEAAAKGEGSKWLQARKLRK